MYCPALLLVFGFVFGFVLCFVLFALTLQCKSLLTLYCIRDVVRSCSPLLIEDLF